MGTLYSITTISGPPIALFYNNQGLKQGEFKAAIAQLRVVESYSTCIAYYLLGLFTTNSTTLFTVIAPPVLVGLPLGLVVAHRLSVETFRRVCMGFDSGIVGYGLSQTLVLLFKASADQAYFFWFVVLAIDFFLLYRYFNGRSRGQVARERVSPSVIGDPPVIAATGG